MAHAEWVEGEIVVGDDTMKAEVNLGIFSPFATKYGRRKKLQYSIKYRVNGAVNKEHSTTSDISYFEVWYPGDTMRFVKSRARVPSDDGGASSVKEYPVFLVKEDPRMGTQLYFFYEHVTCSNAHTFGSMNPTTGVVSTFTSDMPVKRSWFPRIFLDKGEEVMHAVNTIEEMLALFDGCSWAQEMLEAKLRSDCGLSMEDWGNLLFIYETQCAE